MGFICIRLLKTKHTLLLLSLSRTAVNGNVFCDNVISCGAMVDCGVVFLCPLRGDEELAPGMRLWRKAIAEVRSAAQLSLCVRLLQKSTAWERSIMKVVRYWQSLSC